MPSQYTNLGLEKQATGENANTWGDITNTNFDMVDEALSGIYTISSSATSQTVTAPSIGTAAQQTRFATYIYNGSPSGPVTVTLPTNVKKVVNVVNNTSQNITFQIGSNTTTTTVFANSSGIIHSDGADNVYSLSEGSSSELRHSGSIKASATATGITVTGGLIADSVTTGSVVSTSNGHITVAPNGTGDVRLDTDTVRVGDANANALVTTNGTGDLTLNTNGGTNSGSVVIQDGANNDVVLTANGTGSVKSASTFEAAGTVQLNGTTNNWTIEVDSDDHLLFKYNGTAVFAIQDTGAIIAKNDVTAFGTPT